MALTVALLILAALTTAHPPVSRADTLTGAVRALGRPSGPVLLRWTLDRDPARGVWRSWYRATTGEVVAEDEVDWDGDRLRAYRYVRHTTGERASAVRHGDQMVIVQDLGGRHREAREPWDDAILVGPMVVPYVQRHWSDLGAGRTLAVRYAVLDQLRSFRFTLRREEGPGAARPDRVVVRMSLANPVLRLLVAPSEIELSTDGRRLRALRGRLLPVVPRGTTFRALQGELTVDDASARPRTPGSAR